MTATLTPLLPLVYPLLAASAWPAATASPYFSSSAPAMAALSAAVCIMFLWSCMKLKSATTAIMPTSATSATQISTMT